MSDAPRPPREPWPHGPDGPRHGDPNQRPRYQPDQHQPDQYRPDPYQSDPYQREQYPPDPYQRRDGQGGYDQGGYHQPRSTSDPYARPAEPRHQGGYPGQPRPPQSAPRPPESRPAPERHRPEAPVRSGGGFRIPGLGVVLAIVGALVQLLSLTVLPWMAQGGDPASLVSLWKNLSDGQARGFGDWYVLIFSYPLVILGVLLAFSAVLESVAMKVIWAGLAILGVGYLLLRYGIAPVTGLFGVEKDFTTRDVVVAVAAVAATVVVVFVLKSAVTMFRRVAGLVLLALSGVHVGALADLANSDGLTGLGDLGIGAFGPVVGYVLIGIAALVGPRRFVPGA
ncbi:hypothetical protein V5P93_004510 [Actinokineospora auranticolor]|nr:hypothetical protein [Actinokineospora auranticolor]